MLVFGLDVVEPRDVMLFIPGHGLICPRHNVLVSSTQVLLSISVSLL